MEGNGKSGGIATDQGMHDRVRSLKPDGKEGSIIKSTLIDMTKAEKRKAAIEALKALPKQPKTIAGLLKRIQAIEEYLGLR